MMELSDAKCLRNKRGEKKNFPRQHIADAMRELAEKGGKLICINTSKNIRKIFVFVLHNGKELNSEMICL